MCRIIHLLIPHLRSGYLASVAQSVDVPSPGTASFDTASGGREGMNPFHARSVEYSHKEKRIFLA